MVVILLVLGFGIVSATRNTVDLLRDRADIGIGIITSEIEDHLKSARDGTYIDGTYGDDGGVLDNSRVSSRRVRTGRNAYQTLEDRQPRTLE